MFRLNQQRLLNSKFLLIVFSINAFLITNITKNFEFKSVLKMCNRNSVTDNILLKFILLTSVPHMKQTAGDFLMFWPYS